MTTSLAHRGDTLTFLVLSGFNFLLQLSAKKAFLPFLFWSDMFRFTGTLKKKSFRMTEEKSIIAAKLSERKLCSYSKSRWNWRALYLSTEHQTKKMLLENAAFVEGFPAGNVQNLLFCLLFNRNFVMTSASYNRLSFFVCSWYSRSLYFWLCVINYFLFIRQFLDHQAVASFPLDNNIIHELVSVSRVDIIKTSTLKSFHVLAHFSLTQWTIDSSLRFCQICFSPLVCGFDWPFPKFHWFSFNYSIGQQSRNNMRHKNSTIIIDLFLDETFLLNYSIICRQRKFEKKFLKLRK